MTANEPVKQPRARSYRAMWIAAAILAVMASLGAVHLLGKVSVFGVKAVAESGEVPVEERPVQPSE
jgi:hypothetical protein